jgi:cysteine-rich repeat protein
MGVGPGGAVGRACAVAAAFLLGAAVCDAATLTRGPYLQLLTSGSVTVVWNTDVPAACALDIGPVGEATTVVSGATGAVCALEVSGLSPGTEYRYTPFGDGIALDEPSTFHTDDPARPFSFFVLGDSGCGCSAQRAVAARMLAAPADFILHTGDMIYENGEAEDFDPRFFVPYRDLLRRVVLWPSRGNHDVRTANGAPWRDAFWTPANNAAGTEDYYSFDYGNAHVVVLDSNANTTPGSAQHEFLDQDLAASTARWKFVVFHHTIYSGALHGSDLDIRADLTPVFDRHRVDMVFMGHDHDYERTLPLYADTVVAPGAGTVYVTTGGGGKELYDVEAGRRTAYAESAYHVTRVAIDGDTLDLNMIRSDGAIRDTMSLTKAAAVACGNGVVEPGEACDVGGGNGAPGTGCSTDCRLVGGCGDSGEPCTTTGDCPAGEPCCGDAVVDDGEECDDGNRLDGDCCSRTCRREPEGCEPLQCATRGPHVVAADAARVIALDAEGDGIAQRWRTRGRFTLPIDASAYDTRTVALTFSAGGDVLYHGELSSSSFAGGGRRCPRRWRFEDPTASTPGAPGWRSARLRQGGGRRTCRGTVEFNFRSGRNGGLIAPRGRMRQTIQSGDTCATALLDCRSGKDRRRIQCTPVSE